jgi:hypothetical protein
MPSTTRRRSSALCERTHHLNGVIRSAASDPEVAQVLAKNRHDRHVGLRLVADALAAKPRYDPEVAVERTADLLYALGTEDAYLPFVIDRGWSADEWERWMVDTVSSHVLLPG